MDRMRYSMCDPDFDRRAVGNERGSTVTRTCLKRTRTTVYVSLRCLIGFVPSVRGMAIEQVVRNILGDLTRAGCNRVCEKDRNAGNQPMHALTVASRRDFANLPHEPAFSAASASLLCLPKSPYSSGHILHGHLAPLFPFVPYRVHWPSLEFLTQAWRSTVGVIEAMSYALEPIAFGDDGEPMCRVQKPIDIAEGEVHRVHVVMPCAR